MTAEGELQYAFIDLTACNQALWRPYSALGFYHAFHAGDLRDPRRQWRRQVHHDWDDITDHI